MQTLSEKGFVLIKLIDRDIPFDLNLMQRVGTFTWWYVDLVDDAGNGLVLMVRGPAFFPA